MTFCFQKISDRASFSIFYSTVTVLAHIISDPLILPFWYRIRTECDRIICTRAGEGGCSIIKSVAVGFRTRRLEHLGVICWLASVLCLELPSAAVLRLPKLLAGAEAPLAVSRLQLSRT